MSLIKRLAKTRFRRTIHQGRQRLTGGIGLPAGTLADNIFKNFDFAREFARQIQALPEESQRMLLPRALLNALRRFNTTRNIQDVSSSTRDIYESEAERLESELSMIRYISWAIPSIGFIGTVRGIGEALAQADKAVKGDIAGVTQSLGVAFNSTFIALLISIFLMFLVHQLQLVQERLVFDSETYCDDKVIRHLKAD